MAELGLPCCTRAFSSYGEWGPLLQALEHADFSSCDTRDKLLPSMWNLPGPGIKPMSSALASGFLSTAPPGKS